jgi:hypothetical protein
MRRPLNGLLRQPLRSAQRSPRISYSQGLRSSEAGPIALVTKAVQARKTTPRRLLEAMNQRSRDRHRQLMAEIRGDVAAGAESPLEMKYLHDLERPHGLPRGNRQQRRHGLPYLSDVGYDEFRVLVELDGRVGHECRAISRYESRQPVRFDRMDHTALRLVRRFVSALSRRIPDCFSPGHPRLERRANQVSRVPPRARNRAAGMIVRV